MVEILRIGHFFITDDQGFIVNEASLEKVIMPWNIIVTEIVQALLINLGDIIHSIYLRGSVASGQAIEGISDVDFIIVVSSGEETLERSWEETLIKRMKIKYAFCSSVDIKYINHKNILSSSSPHHAYTRMLLKTQSICVYGKSLENLIRRYKPGTDMVYLSPFIKTDIARSVNALQTADDLTAEYINRTCQWIAKQIVRVGFEMVMENEKTYTRDLYFCFEAFSKHFPDKKKNMEKVLRLAVDPHPDPKETLKLLTDFGYWIVSKVNYEPENC